LKLNNFDICGEFSEMTIGNIPFVLIKHVLHFWQSLPTLFYLTKWKTHPRKK
jgi:hypothetical protein